MFVRSMAARDRLGGLADLAAAAMVLMRAVYDIVLVETVGVGQSETEVAEVADTVVFAVQPGSGDSLQFMKAGIVEIPDVALVTKADLGGIAERAKRDLEGVLGIVPGSGGRPAAGAASFRNDGAGDRPNAGGDRAAPGIPRSRSRAPAGRRRTRRGWRGGCARNLAGVAPCSSARARSAAWVPRSGGWRGLALQAPLDLRASGWPVRGQLPCRRQLRDAGSGVSLKYEKEDIPVLAIIPSRVRFWVGIGIPLGAALPSPAPLRVKRACHLTSSMTIASTVRSSRCLSYKAVPDYP